MTGPYPRAVARFPRLRQSQLAHFADCPLSAAFAMRAALPPEDAGQLATSGWSDHRQAGGTLAHAVVARALAEMMAAGHERVSPDAVTEIFNDEIALRKMAPGARFALSAVELTDMLRVLRKWARDNEWTVSEIAGVEMRLETIVQYPDGNPDRIDQRWVDRTLTGQLDLLLISDDDHATVVDQKSGWGLPPARGTESEGGSFKTDDKIEGYFQQRFYALLVFRTFPSIKSVTLREFYLRRSEPREATIWREDLPQLLAEFGALAERFDAAYEAQAPDHVAVSLHGAARDVVRALDGDGDDLTALDRLRDLIDGNAVPLHRAWPPSPGGHCSYCPKAHDCPVDPDLRGDGAIETPEQAVAIAGEFMVARRVMEARRGQLGRWSEVHGPIRVRDGKRIRFFGYVMARHTSKPGPEEVARAVADGRDPRRLYKTRTRTEFRDFSPDTPGRAWEDGDVVDAFERAAEYQRRQNEVRR